METAPLLLFLFFFLHIFYGLIKIEANYVYGFSSEFNKNTMSYHDFTKVTFFSFFFFVVAEIQTRTLHMLYIVHTNELNS